MNRFANLVALIAVLAVVSAMSASFTGTSLALVTVLVASGVFVYRFALSGELADALTAPQASAWAFAAHALGNFFRFAIGAVVIGWMVVSVLWFAIG